MDGPKYAQTDDVIGSYTTTAEAQHMTAIYAKIEQWNKQIDDDMMKEMNRHPNALARVRDEVPFAHRMPSTATLTALPTSLLNNMRAGFPGPLWLRAALVAAGLTCATTIGPYFLGENLSEDMKKQIVVSSIKSTVSAFCTSAAAAYLISTLENALMKPEVLARVFGTALKSLVSPAATAVTTTIAYAFKALWDGVSYLCAQCVDDTKSLEIKLQELKETVSFDNIVKNLAATVGSWAIRGLCAGPLSAFLGPIGWIVSGVIFVITSTVVDDIILRKNAGGGWLSWLYSLVMTDRRRCELRGTPYDAIENLFTSSIRCNINLCIPIQPMRSKRNGRLYERVMIYEWIDKHGTDPIDRQPATRLDYVPDSQATHWSQKIANEFGAKPVVMSNKSDFHQ